MKKMIIGSTVLLIALGLAGCGGDPEDHAQQKDDNHPGRKPNEHKKDANNKHGERYKLGQADISGYSVTVAVLGKIKAGDEGVLDVDVSGGSPAAVRAWVGVESAQGSLKGRLHKSGGSYHGHIKVPDPMPTSSAVWIEVEGTDRNKSKTSFKLE